MMKTQKTVIVGNALAGIISALELAKQGQQVTLINPGGPLGGYFSGIMSGGVMFDAGLVKLELDGYLKQLNANDLASYKPEMRNDVGRFLNIVRDWALKYVDLTELPMPKMLVEGERYDDVILTNAYHSFSQLPFAAQSAKELDSALLDTTIHARQKVSGAAYETLDYATASIANHGKTMHEKLIAPFLKKAMGVTADFMLARYHRVAWLPLFYRETLADCFRGKLPTLKPTKFHYPTMGSVGKLVGLVKEELLRHPNITYITQPVTQLKQQGDGWRVTCQEFQSDVDHLVWTYQPAQFLKAVGLVPTPIVETKAKLGLLLLRIKKSDARDICSLMNVIDLNYAIYRITNQTLCAEDQGDYMNITAEFNLDYFQNLYGESQEDAFIIEQLLAELASINMVSADTQAVNAEIKRIPGGFLVPDAKARDAWELDHARIKQQFPTVALLAMSSGFFATSLNDQVVQGLYYALTRRENLAKKMNKEQSVCL